ncbi:MAG: lytic transglycosylase [Actinobacteria bacterium]|nr:MAG: lytic transglycosylase [Actinomycetota bacterium]
MRDATRRFFSATLQRVRETLDDPRRSIIASAVSAGAAVVFIAVGHASTVHSTLTLEVDGVSRPVSTWSRTVHALLNENGVKLGAHDLVSVDTAARVEDGQQIVVRTAHPVELTVDGDHRTVWTTAPAIDSVLSDLDLSGNAVTVAAGRSTSRANVASLVSRPQNVAVALAGGITDVKVRPGDDARTALSRAGVPLSPIDRVNVTFAEGKLNIGVQRVVRGNVTTETPVAFSERVEETDALFEGESVVTTLGVPGKETQTTWQESIDGTVTHSAVVGKTLAQEPQEQVRSNGTKKATPEALLAAGLDPKATLEDGVEDDGTTSKRYRAALGTISSAEEIAELRGETGTPVAESQPDNSPTAPVPTYSGGDPKGIAQAMVAARGWSDSEFQCLVSLWQKESGWNPYAQNPSSGAYGIPQSLPGSKMAAAGADWQTNPATQITWGLNYIAGRYGTPCAAWGHSVAVNWY